jgi:hypothetical protein
MTGSLDVVKAISTSLCGHAVAKEDALIAVTATCGCSSPLQRRFGQGLNQRRIGKGLRGLRWIEYFHTP